MREIKFRGYSDGLFGKGMHYGWGCYIEDPTKLYILQGGDRTRVNALMQYTGLKDKNGKEIYEGDILAVKDWGIREESSQVLGNAQIVWDTQECGWRITPTLYIEDTYDLLGKAIPKSEVIGNIYENPDLLT